MGNNISFRLKSGVQVRKEKFGLLFYDYRGPKLYFIPSKNLISPNFFCGSTSLKELINEIQNNQGWPDRWVSQFVTELLTKLTEKDLIYEQPVC